jgi:hypothetical protein
VTPAGFPGVLACRATPLNRHRTIRTFAAVDDERDVEVFERIPWESLTERTDRRWIAYVVAAVIVLGALGVSVGRHLGGAPVAPPPTTLAAPTEAITTTTAAMVSPSSPPTTSPMLTEADLMALPAADLEWSAAALAEWFVVDHFTRDTTGGDRSYVEWVRAFEVEWTSTTTASVTVLARRLAAQGNDPYRRLEEEAWEVITELTEDGWDVTAGPIPVEPPSLHREDVEPTSEWVDGAGLIWPVEDPGA